MYAIEPAAGQIITNLALADGKLLVSSIDDMPLLPTEFAERRAALLLAAAEDGIEAIPDELSVERDAAEAERFRLECERDLKGEDE